MAEEGLSVSGGINRTLCQLAGLLGRGDRGYLRGRLPRKEGRDGEATGCRQRRWIADILLFMPSELPCERSRHRAHRYVQP